MTAKVPTSLLKNWKSASVSSITSVKMLYVSQPHKARLRELHQLSGKLLLSSRKMTKSHQIMPDPDDMLARLRELKSTIQPTAILAPIRALQVKQTQAAEEPKEKPLIVLQRKDSPEYFLTISSSVYQEYTVRSDSRSIRPKSASKRRKEKQTPMQLFERGNRPKSSGKHTAFYLRSFSSSKPLTPRNYMARKHYLRADSPF